MTFTTIGVDYCRLHFGTRNEDDGWRDDDGNLACDARDDDDASPCVLVPLGFHPPAPGPSETCSYCAQPIWLSFVWVPWAPEAVFHVACDVYAKRRIAAMLAG